MRRLFQIFSRYRPRVLTLALLALIAALVTLSNLSVEQSLPQDWMAFGHKSYGWPLIWHRFVLCDRSSYTEGWYVSYGRLAVNLAIWLLILVVPTATCEWLVRRYRPRFRWSLRTMLIAVVLIALGCGWFVHARKRANEEDALIAAIRNERGDVWMERWGPRWLDLLGVDRFRRRIVGVSINQLFGFKPGDREILQRISCLRGLRHLDLCFNEWTSELGLAGTLDSLARLRTLGIYGAPAREWQAAVGKMSHLERLTVAYDADLCACLESLPNLKSLAVSSCWDPEDSHRLLTTVGKLNLEELCLTHMIIRGSSLACLNGLNELRFLGLSAVYENPSAIGNFQRKSEGGLLLNLPPLARLEAIDLEESEVYDGDVAALANLPRLRWLNLAHTRITDAGLARLASAASLDELAVSGEWIPPSWLAGLSAIERLRSLHLGGYVPYQLNIDIKYSPLPLDNGSAIAVVPAELEAFRQALETLRRSRAGIVIDNHVNLHRSRYAPDIEDLGPDALAERHSTWWPASEWPALSPTHRANFQKRGGWARFDAAGWGKNGTSMKF
jgi:hypothetical protein